MKRFALGAIIFIAACTTNKVNVQPPVVPAPATIATTDLVFGNAGKPIYAWYDGDTLAANVLDVEDSSTLFSRWTMRADLLSATRSMYAIVDGWIQPTDEVSLNRPTVNDEWHEYARQSYQGTPQYMPSSIAGPGVTPMNAGRWTWHDDNSNASAGDWQYQLSWTWDGTSLRLAEKWDQHEDGDPPETWTHFDRDEIFTRSQGFIGFHDAINNYTVCIKTAQCS